MRLQVTHKTPLDPGGRRLALRGSVVLRLAPGEDPHDVPSHRDVIAHSASAASRLDGGSLDHCLCRHGHAMRVTRAFEAACNIGNVGHRHEGWDEVEQEVGLSRTFRVELGPGADPFAAAQSAAEHPAVEMASPVYLSATPFDDSADAAEDEREFDPHDRRAYELVGGPRAAALEAGDPAVIVAVVDSGISDGHPDLAGRVRPGFDMVDLDPQRVSQGLELFGDTAGRDRAPMDEMGHGTGCAGIIAARGLRVAPGLAGACPVLPVRALAAARVAGRTEPTAIGSGVDIDAALKRAVDLGARVLNLSFGTPGTALRPGDPVPHVEVIRYAARRGCVLVSASGNSGDDTVYFPAALPGVIAVGAVDLGGRPTGFTTRGSHVALSAPGERIPSVAVDGYQLNTGTSFAAPFVSAAAALLVSRSLRYGVPLSPSAVRNALVATAEPFPSGVDTKGCGAGVLNVAKAVQLVDEELREEPGEGSMKVA